MSETYSNLDFNQIDVSLTNMNKDIAEINSELNTIKQVMFYVLFTSLGSMSTLLYLNIQKCFKKKEKAQIIQPNTIKENI